MSTNSTVLFSTPVKAAFPEELSSGLCTSLLPSGIERGVAFKETPDKKLRVSVRPFCVSTDVSILYKWLSQEYGGPLLARTQPPEELEESYASMIASDFAQPFMALINDVPVCQVDVYKAQQDAISLYYNVRPGDYGIRVLPAPLAIQQNMVLVIRTCLEYFFSFPEVGRITADVDIKSEWDNTLFRQAGFRASQKIQLPYKHSMLYVCTRNSFRLAATH
ncbi:GNAT family N-acetyltransferase [Flavitalea sp. BT771]|uniref:GNAT family N-acetyltransferase n=1 Tax=Flavitalea sp. BT771 TaxID=3063329 RepID=UPI0026E1C690|nr:GNAT family N-acetyltransferase [Flavitalea sp. BT771]MDO6429135.1 GNAT family N-acetyltransferase [Flavitalea sp. BT771]MDV6218737.1 GNAT family N-acetyltransferase [Flavitalea sp. BT771]